MKSLLLASILLLPTALSAQRVAPSGTPDAPFHTLVWADEFDVSGHVDSTRWTHETGFVRNHEDQWYQAANAYVLHGTLQLEAHADSVPNPRYDASAPASDWQRSRPYARYTSASINTRGKYAFQYGRLEVRARIPAVCGAWPAIWTLGQRMPWPSNGECDVMEFYQVDGRPHILANAAWGTDRQWQAHWNSRRIPYAHFLAQDPDWGEKFHTWTMDWTAERITIAIDGEVVNDIDLSTTINGRVGRGTNPFHQPHYILLNLAIGGDNGGQLQPDAFPMRYEIDYVRVYQ